MQWAVASCKRPCQRMHTAPSHVFREHPMSSGSHHLADTEMPEPVDTAGQSMAARNLEAALWGKHRAEMRISIAPAVQPGASTTVGIAAAIILEIGQAGTAFWWCHA